ncbi:ead/Ea22-like family protein [Klebsiella quasivariicola]|uniref:ead/Ea22-like family protein n=1 Tax=Klebsiella quasivariicola TaxID=2026240 RepID=UPI0009BB8DBC|nr:ead/Ea22-like family protein [Klebsiella quasivariicola]SLN99789.1 RelE family toxin-antitoxin system [Klebsiella quasivariicola]
MTDITELAQRMKAAAEKASSGEWVKESGDGWEACCSANDQANGEFIIAHFEGPDAAENREFVQAANPANILALVEALEKAQQHIARQEQILLNQDESLSIRRGELEAAHQRIAELESRTVTVKLPEPPGPMSVGARTVYFGIVADVVSAFQYGITAAGIKVEVE